MSEESALLAEPALAEDWSRPEGMRRGRIFSRGAWLLFRRRLNPAERFERPAPRRLRLAAPVPKRPSRAAD
jgi:hypothetical protein